jgi:hypothetical protein
VDRKVVTLVIATFLLQWKYEGIDHAPKWLQWDTSLAIAAL